MTGGEGIYRATSARCCRPACPQRRSNAVCTAEFRFRILVVYGFLLPSITRDWDFLFGRKATTTTRPDQWWLWGGEARRCRTDWPAFRAPEQSTHCAPANMIIRCVGDSDCGGLGLSIPLARPRNTKDVDFSARHRSVLDPGFAWQPGKTLKIEAGCRVAATALQPQPLSAAGALLSKNDLGLVVEETSNPSNLNSSASLIRTRPRFLNKTQTPKASLRAGAPAGLTSAIASARALWQGRPSAIGVYGNLFNGLPLEGRCSAVAVVDSRVVAICPRPQLFPCLVGW